MSMKLEESHMRIISMVCLVLSMTIPILMPFGLPLSVGQETLGVYNAIEGLNAGDVIFFSIDTLVTSIPETGPGCIVVINHLFLKEIRIVFFSTYIDGMICFEKFVMPSVDTGDAKYGVDWVNLGYFAGDESAFASLGTDIRGLISVDNYGTSLEDLPLMEEVNGAKDIKMFIGVTGASTEYYIRQYWATYDLPVIVVMSAANAIRMYTYYQAGQVKLTMGIRGAAEYEKITNRAGQATAACDALSLGHLLVIAGIILGNVSYQYNKTRRGVT